MGRSGKRKGYRPRSPKEQARDAARVAAAEAAEARRAIYQRRILLICSLLLLFGFLFGMAIWIRGCTDHTALFTPHCRIDEDMFAYYFYEYYIAELTENRHDYVAAGLAPERPLREQMYDAQRTWEDYFVSQVKDALRRMLVFAETAYREGVATSYLAACEAAAEEKLAVLRSSAAEEGNTLASYLADRYSDRVSEDTVRRAVVLASLAEARYRVFAANVYTEEERMALYEKDPAAFRTADVIAYSVSADLTGLVGEEAIRAAYQETESRAHAIASADGEEAFCAALAADMKEKELSLSERMIKTRVENAYIFHIPTAASGLIEDWVNSPGRVAGDVAILGQTGQYTVVYCLTAPHEVAYHRASAHYILLPYVNYHTEALAREAAEALLKTFYAGTPTAEEFVLLAKENASTDSTSFLAVTYGDLEKPLCDWLMDGERMAGDTAVIAGQDGYYLLYYTEKSPLPLWQEMIADALREGTYRTLLAESGVAVYESACTVPSIIPVL